MDRNRWILLCQHSYCEECFKNNFTLLQKSEIYKCPLKTCLKPYTENQLPNWCVTIDIPNCKEEEKERYIEDFNNLNVQDEAETGIIYGYESEEDMNNHLEINEESPLQRLKRDAQKLRIQIERSING